MIKELIILAITLFMKAAAMLETPPVAEPSTPVVETPAPIVETPAPVPEPTPAPVVETPTLVPEPTPAPVVETPAPAPEPTPTPVVETPAPAPEPTPTPVVETPAPAPEPTPTPVVETPAPAPEPTPTPVVETPTPVETPDTHCYEWQTNGDTRTLTCPHCGDQKITEYCYNGVWGYYDELSATTLWSYVNITRGNTQYSVMEQGVCIGIATVDALIEDEALMEKARFRATETAVNFSHGENANECLAWGLGTPEMAMDSWLWSYSHCYAITDPIYIHGGIACFWFDSDNSGENLTPIWVLELGY